MSDKPLDEYELDIKEFVITGFNRTKLESMIDGVSRSKEEGLGYHQKHFNPRNETQIKPSYSSSLRSSQKRLYSHFVPANNVKVLN